MLEISDPRTYMQEKLFSVIGAVSPEAGLKAFREIFDPNRGGSREGDLPQPRILQQRPGDPRSGGGRHYVEDTGGQAGFHHGLRKKLGCQRGKLRRLQDHGASCGDGGGYLAGGHGEREVPRREEQARPHRLVLDQNLVLALRGGEVAARNPGPSPPRTNGGTPHRKRLPHGTRPAACPFPRSSAARSPRHARSPDRRPGAGSRRAPAVQCVPRRLGPYRPRRARRRRPHSWRRRG